MAALLKRSQRVGSRGVVIGVPAFSMSVGGMGFGESLFLTLEGGFTLLCFAAALAWIFGELSLLARLGRGRPEPKKIWTGRIADLKLAGKFYFMWGIAIAAWQLNIWLVAALDEVFPRHYFGNANNPRMPPSETPNWLFWPILIVVVWMLAIAGAKSGLKNEP